MATLFSFHLNDEIPEVGGERFLRVEIPQAGPVVHVWTSVHNVAQKWPLELDTNTQKFINVRASRKNKGMLEEAARRISNRVNIRRPFSKLHKYLTAAVMNTRCDRMPDGSFYCENSQISGVYADGPTEQACRQKFEEVLIGWIIICLDNNQELPFLT